MEIEKQEHAEKEPIVRELIACVDAYEADSSTWCDRGDDIVDRYKDARPDNKSTKASKTRFNILWSNVETLQPATYANPPMPNVDRRHQDDDELGNTVARILERCTKYYVDSDDFDDVMNQAVQDRLLPGRGTAWVRYVPNFEDDAVEGSEEIKQEGVQLTDDVVEGESLTGGDDYDAAGDQKKQYTEQELRLAAEDVVIDYVHWKEFGHSVARTWQECTRVWRCVYINKKEVKARFKSTAYDADGRCLLTFDCTRKGGKVGENGTAKETHDMCTKVYEIWDKEAKKAYWMSRDLPHLLDERVDPLGLKGFFPCPKPLFATLANDSLTPVPDYVLYQDQAMELDNITKRISALTRALKVAGVYDASAQGIEKLLTSGVENVLVPVESWAMFALKGGLKGAIEFLPVQEIAAVVLQLYEARDRVKNDIYEITGISDIIRGATKASETATAQEIKGQFANLRLGSRQKQAARFSRDLVRIMAEIIAEFFSIETIQKLSGIELLTEQEKLIYGQLIAAGQPLPKEAPKNTMDLMEKPTWQEVEALLRNDAVLKFKIDIETDSTIKSDQDAEKAARTEFLSAAGSFIQQAVQVQEPAMQPVLMEMLMFGVRGFKIGREMESTFKVAMDEIRKRAEQAGQNAGQPTPAQQAELEAKQAEQQFKAAELQIKQEQLQIDKAELQLREREIVANTQIENQKIQADMAKATMDAQKPPVDAGVIAQAVAQGQQQTMEAINNLVKTMQAVQPAPAPQPTGVDVVIAPAANIEE